MNTVARSCRCRTEKSFDVAVVGAGPAGLIAGLACAAVGSRNGGDRSPRRYSRRPHRRASRRLDQSAETARTFGETLKPASEPLTRDPADRCDGHLAARAGSAFRGVAKSDCPPSATTSQRCSDSGARRRSRRTRLTRLRQQGATVSDLGGECAAISTHERRHRHGPACRGSRRPRIADAHRRRHRGRRAGLTRRRRSSRPSRTRARIAASRPSCIARSGPLTVVPGPGNTSSLVWVETPDEAERLAALDDDAIPPRAGDARRRRCSARCRRLRPRRSYPLSGQTASSLGKRRVALVGEAAHVMPPIGAQGLNLGFRDAAVLAEIAGEALSAGEDIGGEPVLARYDRLRRADVASRVFAVDLLNRSLLSSIPGVHFARGLGLFALATNQPLCAPASCAKASCRPPQAPP